MASRAFPVVYSPDVERSALFWQAIGFTRFVEIPGPDAELGYVGLRRGAAELAVTHSDWGRERYGLELGDGPRFEMYVYVEDLEGLVERLRAEGATILREAEDMPWGERIAGVADPDGNPVALCAQPAQQPAPPGALRRDAR
jgi:lactoylglutathione lyase